MLIIGFGNKARQGKDTAAEAIWDFYANRNLAGGPTTKVGIFKFANALYYEVNTALKNWHSNGGGHFLGALGFADENNKWKYITEILDCVQREPNTEISRLSPYGKHPKLLQWWGTDFRRAQDPDYWTKKLFATIPANLDVALVSDVRFPNEADGIKQRGGYNVNIKRLREDGTMFYASDRPLWHPSETALDGYNWDFRLINQDHHAALLGEQAITLCEYLRGLNG